MGEVEDDCGDSRGSVGLALIPPPLAGEGGRRPPGGGQRGITPPVRSLPLASTLPEGGEG
jgi:hypothetical protein